MTHITWGTGVISKLLDFSLLSLYPVLLFLKQFNTVCKEMLATPPKEWENTALTCLWEWLWGRCSTSPTAPLYRHRNSWFNNTQASWVSIMISENEAQVTLISFRNIINLNHILKLLFVSSVLAEKWNILMQDILHVHQHSKFVKAGLRVWYILDKTKPSFAQCALTTQVRTFPSSCNIFQSLKKTYFRNSKITRGCVEAWSLNI